MFTRLANERTAVIRRLCHEQYQASQKAAKKDQRTIFGLTMATSSSAASSSSSSSYDYPYDESLPLDLVIQVRTFRDTPKNQGIDWWRNYWCTNYKTTTELRRGGFDPITLLLIHYVSHTASIKYSRSTHPINRLFRHTRSIRPRNTPIHMHFSPSLITSCQSTPFSFIHVGKDDFFVQNEQILGSFRNCALQG